MSGAPKDRPLNIADSEGRPVLRPAGNNTAAPAGDFPAKPTAKPATKQQSNRPKSPLSDSARKYEVKASPPQKSGAKSSGVSKSIHVGGNESKACAATGKSPVKNGVSKAPCTVGGGKSPRIGNLGRSTEASLKGNVSLSASCSSEASSESSSSSLAAMRKAAALELYAQRKQKIAAYGRRQSGPKSGRVVPDGIPMSPPPVEAKKRCGWITSQSDPVYVAFHDEEWGVPVHDDKKLFELLVLSGALAELSWPAILSKRDTYREVFVGFDPAIVASFGEKKIKSLKTNSNIMLYEGKLRGIVDNAKHILKIKEEFGTFDNYCWGFVNHKPIVNKYRYPRQVPVKNPKAEVISKDLVKRGFRFVGPTIMYSFMQAAGMTNDHLVNCFRFEECNMLLEGQQTGSCSKEDHEEDLNERERETQVKVADKESIATPYHDSHDET